MIGSSPGFEVMIGGDFAGKLKVRGMLVFMEMHGTGVYEKQFPGSRWEDLARVRGVSQTSARSVEAGKTSWLCQLQAGHRSTPWFCNADSFDPIVFPDSCKTTLRQLITVLPSSAFSDVSMKIIGWKTSRTMRAPCSKPIILM